MIASAFAGDAAFLAFGVVALVTLITALCRGVSGGAYALLGLAVVIWLAFMPLVGWLLLIGAALGACLLPSRRGVRHPVPVVPATPTPNLDRAADAVAARRGAAQRAPGKPVAPPAPAVPSWDERARHVPRPDGPRSAWEQMNEVAHG